MPTDPTAYYGMFWDYAAYYGEEAARANYGSWAPPVGTPPPPGYVIPAAPQQAAAQTAPSGDASATGAEAPASADEPPSEQ